MTAVNGYPIRCMAAVTAIPSGAGGGGEVGRDTRMEDVERANRLDARMQKLQASVAAGTAQLAAAKPMREPGRGAPSAAAKAQKKGKAAAGSGASAVADKKKSKELAAKLAAGPCVSVTTRLRRPDGPTSAPGPTRFGVRNATRSMQHATRNVHFKTRHSGLVNHMIHTTCMMQNTRDMASCNVTRGGVLCGLLQHDSIH